MADSSILDGNRWPHWGQFCGLSTPARVDLRDGRPLLVHALFFPHVRPKDRGVFFPSRAKNQALTFGTDRVYIHSSIVARRLLVGLVLPNVPPRYASGLTSKS